LGKRDNLEKKQKVNEMEKTLESTIVVNLKTGKDAEFEKVANQIGSQVAESVQNSQGYDVFITTSRDGSKGWIRQKAGDSDSIINYFKKALMKNLPDLQRTGQVTHSYLFGTNDINIKDSSEQATGIKPTTYDRHIISR